MKYLILTITFFSLLAAQNLQAQKKDMYLNKNQIKNIGNLKTKKYKSKDGKIYTEYKIKNIKQYLDIPNLIILTPIEFETLEAGQLCEDTTIPCPDGFECKNPIVAIKRCGWLSWLFGCEYVFRERLEKECIPVGELNNGN